MKIELQVIGNNKISYFPLKLIFNLHPFFSPFLQQEESQKHFSPPPPLHLTPDDIKNANVQDSIFH